MKPSASAFAALLIVEFLAAGETKAYEQYTHEVLSAQSFNLSTLGDIRYQWALGQFSFNNDGSLGYGKNPDSTGVAWDSYALVQLGSWYEDDGKRPLNHFFNPINNKELTPPSIVGTAATSPNWALASPGTYPGQNNSFVDARGYYWAALTANDPVTYSTNLGLTYQSLGQVIHHIQDMAQPQHSRDEAHCNAFKGCLLPGVLFGYYHPSLYEGYILACTRSPQDPTPIDPTLNCPLVWGAASYPAVFDQTNTANGNPFTLARFFWSSSGNAPNNKVPGKGIAEYSNAGFIGTRTNFKGTPGAILPNDPDVLPLPDGTGTALVSVPLNDGSLFGTNVPSTTATMDFITRPVTDFLRGSATADVRTSTTSLFAEDLSQLQLPSPFSYNRFVASAAASQLIPRAIGYSAGLLNYFFRGQIGIAKPHEGVYGIIDHAAQYSSTSITNNTSQVQGFRTLKFALTNASPDGETMTNGTLAAVVRFHRNLNFTDSLDNEPGSSGVLSLAAVRGNDEETISAVDVFDGAGNLLGANGVTLTSTPQEFSFQFNNRLLPLNSTDVRVEIVWQGTLGAEASTAVVASTIDISEPSYVSLFNSFDYISIAGQLVTRDQLNADQDLLAQVQPTSCVVGTYPELALQASCFLANTPLLVSLDAKNAAASANNLVYLQNLPAASYVRFAVLTDGMSDTPTTNLLNSSPCNIGDSSIGVQGLNNEISILNVDTTTTPATVNEQESVGDLSAIRGINGFNNVFCVWDGDGSGKVTGDPGVMSKLTQNAIYPVSLAPINFPQNQ